MKHSKSSFSFHVQPSSILKEQTNTSTHSNLKPIFRANCSFRKQNSSVYNARGRLNTLREAFNMIQQQCRQAGIITKDVKLELQFLKEEYESRKLNDLELELQSKIKQLKKKVTISKRSDLLKYQSIQNIFESAQKNHKELQKKVHQIEERVSQLQNVMGVNVAFQRALINY